MAEELKPLPHHRKVGPCLTRPPYRDGKRKKAVKVFTIANESMYLLVFGVPSIDLSKALTDKLQQISTLLHIRQVEYPDAEAFTNTYLAKFDSVKSARDVKRRLDDSSFYGGILHIVYAPEYESVSECRNKMHSYRKINDAVTRKASAEKQRKLKECGLLSEERLQTSHVQLQILSPGLPSSPSNKSATLNNPYSLHLPTPMSSLLSGPQAGDAIDDARHYWASRGFHSLPIVSTSSSTQGISPLPNANRTSSRPTGAIPIAVQQALLCQPILALDNSPPTGSSVSISKDLTKFTPRSVIRAQRSPSAKKRKLL